MHGHPGAPQPLTCPPGAGAVPARVPGPRGVECHSLWSCDLQSGWGLEGASTMGMLHQGWLGAHCHQGSSPGSPQVLRVLVGAL